MYEKDFAALQNLPAWTLLQSHSPPIRDREKKMGDRSTRVFGIAPALIIEQWYPSLGGSRIPVPQPCLESSTTPISLIAFDASSTPVLRPSFRKTAAPLRKQSCHELSSRRRTRLRRTYSWTAGRILGLSFRSPALNLSHRHLFHIINAGSRAGRPPECDCPLIMAQSTTGSVSRCLSSRSYCESGHRLTRLA